MQDFLSIDLARQAVRPCSRINPAASLQNRDAQGENRIDELRLALYRMKSRLGLCSPSRDELRCCLPPEEFDQLIRSTTVEDIECYRSSLVPLVECASADSLSLLAGLVAESFITDRDDLFDLHRDAFAKAVDRLFVNPVMSDIRPEFDRQVSLPILGASWRLPAFFHVSSLRSPFMELRHWDAIRAEHDPIPFCIGTGKPWGPLIDESSE